MLSSGRLEVHDAQSAQLARTLLDATVAHPRPASGPSHRDVTVVIPVLNNAIGLRRLVSTLRGMCVVVVDDGSSPPVRMDDFAGLHCDVRVLRHPVSKGPAAARNAGLAVCQTDFVAFLDSDVVPRRGWLEALLGHFCDPAVALVAPRIVGLKRTAQHGGALRGGAVLARPGPAGSPGRALRDRLLRAKRGHHLPSDRTRERRRIRRDVEVRRRRRPLLALRRGKGAAAVRAIALVGHDHRTTLRKWFARKAFYGSSAAPLAVRHPGKTAPLVLSGWTLLVWLLLAMGSGVGYVASTVVAAITGRKIAKVLSAVDTEPREVAAVAAQGLWSAALQLSSAICRHYWPIALVAAVCFRRCRQVVLVAAVVDGVVDWASRNGNVDDDAQTGRVVLLRPAQAARRHRLRAWPVAGRRARASPRRAQAANPDLKHLLHSDVLIVGAGSAGCVLAETLSRDPARRVTVVESGPCPSDPRVTDQIGNGLRLPIGAASSVVRRYETTLTDRPRRTASIMRGAVVGGSGAVNGGYFCRGSARRLRRLGDPRLVVGRRAATLPGHRDRPGLRRPTAR